MSNQLILIRNAEVESLSRLSPTGQDQLHEMAARLQFADLLPAEILSSSRGPAATSANALAWQLATTARHVVPVRVTQGVEPEQADEVETLALLADRVAASSAPVAVVSSHYFTHRLTRGLGEAFSLGHGEAVVLPLREDGQGFAIDQAKRISLVTQALPTVVPR